VTEWDLTGDWDPPLAPREWFTRNVDWPAPADDPDEEPSEPWAHRGHIWDER
jgi:hypothetical protein